MVEDRLNKRAESGFAVAMAEKESRKGGNVAVMVTEFNRDDPTAGLKVVERDIPTPKAGDTGGSVPRPSLFLVCSTGLCFREVINQGVLERTSWPFS